MIGRDLAAIVEECLLRLDRGENLPAVLGDFPDLEERLKPYLLVAMASRTFPVPVPCQTAQRLGRNQMLAEMNRLEIKGAFRKVPAVPLSSRLMGDVAGLLHSGGFNKLAYSYRLAMVSLVLILSGGFLTLNASAASQPGDFMYRVKQNLTETGLVWLLPAKSQGEKSIENRSEHITFDIPRGSENSIWALPEIGFPPGNPVEGGSIANSAAGHEFLLGEDETADLKDLAKEEKEAEKELAADERDAEKELAAAEREEQKELAADQRETEKELAADQREAEKELAADQREEAQALKEAEKDTSPAPGSSGKKGENIAKPKPNANKNNKNK